MTLILDAAAAAVDLLGFRAVRRLLEIQRRVPLPSDIIAQIRSVVPDQNDILIFNNI